MKKLTPTDVKGLEAEKRLIRLARSLKEDLPWLSRVRKAGVKHDQAGVDVIIYARTITAHVPKVLPIALQVKSSVAGVQKFHAKHGKALGIGVIPVVVNDNRSDETVLHDLVSAIFQGIFSEGQAERVASYLETVRRGMSRRHKNETNPGVPDGKRCVLCTCESEWHGGNCRVPCFAR